MGLKTQRRMTKSNTSTAFITWKHTNMNLYYENDQSQAKVLMPLVLERTSTHILNLIIYIGWWQKRATGAGYFKAETKNYWSVYKHAVVKYQNRCGLCKHPLGQDGELTELHRIKPGAEGGKYVVRRSLNTCAQILSHKTSRKCCKRNGKVRSLPLLTYYYPKFLRTRKRKLYHYH